MASDFRRGNEIIAECVVLLAFCVTDGRLNPLNKGRRHTDAHIHLQHIYHVDIITMFIGGVHIITMWKGNELVQS